jgi:hypothetical protein
MCREGLQPCPTSVATAHAPPASPGGAGALMAVISLPVPCEICVLLIVLFYWCFTAPRESRCLKSRQVQGGKRNMTHFRCQTTVANVPTGALFSADGGPARTRACARASVHVEGDASACARARAGRRLRVRDRIYMID